MKTVLITGAGRGLGKAIAEEFLQRGWHVIATDVDELLLDNIPGRELLLRKRMDVTSDDDVASVFSSLSASGTRLDLIINNAGIDRYFPFSEAPADLFRHVFEVNLFGAYRVNQVFLPMVQQPGGRIILVGSESLNLAVPFMAYPITKKALETYGRVLRQELRFRGIDVITVRPGPIRTALLENVNRIQYPVMDPKLSNAFSIFAGTAPKEVGKVKEPGEVAEFIYRVSGIKNPRAIYRINNSLQLKIAALLPFSFLEKQVFKRLS